MHQTEKNFLTEEDEITTSNENDQMVAPLPKSHLSLFPQKDHILGRIHQPPPPPFTTGLSLYSGGSADKIDTFLDKAVESYDTKMDLLNLSPINIRSIPKKSIFEAPNQNSLGFGQTKSDKNRVFLYIRGLCYARRFVNNMKKAIRSHKTEILNTLHLRIINDRSFFKEKIDTRGEISMDMPFTSLKLHKIWEELNEKVIQPIRVIHPTKKFHIVFDTIILMVTIFCFLIIPLDIGFEMDVLLAETGRFHILIKLCLFALLVLDILINFNTAYLEKGELIKERPLIIKHYFKQGFWRDLLSLLYFYWAFYYSYPYQHWVFNLSSVTFFFRVPNIQRIFNRIEDFLFVDDKFYNYMLFFQLIFRVLLISHLFACVWHKIGISTTGFLNSSWLQNLLISNEPWTTRYLYSLYYVVVVMNTVGFGDITPKNQIEITFTVFFIYFACGLFAYTINSIGLILQNINRSEREFKRNMNILNGYMRQKKINFNLRTKIRNYLEYLWRDEQIHNSEVSHEIISKLSKSLREELLLNANGIILKHFNLFHNNFSEDSLKKLVLIMKEVKFIPGDIIYQQNEINDPYLYIIKKGRIELFLESDTNSKTVFQTLKKNQLFGEISFFSDAARECSAQSTTFTSLYAIKRQSFLDILKDNEEDYESFCKIKDEINLYNDYSNIYPFCSSCKVDTHPPIYCPLLRFTLNTQSVLQKYYFSRGQDRSDHQRSKKKMATIRKFRIAEKKLSEHLFKRKETHSMKSSEFTNDWNLKLFKSSENSKNSLGEENETMERINIYKETFEKNLYKESLHKEGSKEKPSSFQRVLNGYPSLTRPQSLPDLPEKMDNRLQLKALVEEDNDSNDNNKNLESLPFINSVFETSNKINSGGLTAELAKMQSLVYSNKIILPKGSVEARNLASQPKNNQEEVATIREDFRNSNSATVFNFEEYMKAFVSYFPRNNVENVILEANEQTIKRLKKKKIYNLNVVKKHWLLLDGSKEHEVCRTLSPSLKRSQRTANFFKKTEKTPEKKLVGVLEFIKKFKRKKRKTSDRRDALGKKRNFDVKKASKT